MADHLERNLLSAVGEEGTAIGLVADQAHLVHALQHRGDRPGRHAKPLGERRRRHRAIAALRERVERLGVVLDRLGVESMGIASEAGVRHGSDTHQKAREIEGDGARRDGRGGHGV